MDSLSTGRRFNAILQFRRNWMGHGDMRHAAIAKEGGCAALRAINKLINQYECARRQFLAKRATSGNRDNIGHTNPLQRINIGAIIDSRGRQAMSAPMAWQKDGIRPADAPKAQSIRRLPPWRFDALLTQILQAGKIVNT
jgi:hypothetical protein